MITYSNLSIKEFEEVNRNVSSVWLTGINPNGMNYAICFVSTPPYIRIEGERKTVYKKIGVYEKNSSGIHKVLNKLQERVKGKIEQSNYSSDFNIDTCSIFNLEIQITQKRIVEIARYIEKLGFKDIKIKRAHFFS